MAYTPEGKERSRLNAVKHGLRATDDIFIASLPKQEKSIFEDLCESLYQEYAPVNEQEKQILDKIAIQQFRQFRLYKMENLTSYKNADELLTDHSVLYHLDRFSRYDSRIEKQLRLLYSQLHTLLILRSDKVSNTEDNSH